jgi:hypothetical protein
MIPEWSRMLNWWQIGLLAAIPPAIILLYFLKLKRQPLLMPSTYLWRRSLEDLHVNSIWQRLRQNLLLFLQLLLLLLTALALFRPSWMGSELSGDRFIFMVDNSASMSATDVEDSRLAEAKRKVSELIDEMESGDVGMIVSFADGASVVQAYTDSRRALRDRVESIEPTNRVTTIDEALRIADGLANPGRSSEKGNEADVQVADPLPATLYIYSDGRFSDIHEFSLGNLEARYRPIGEGETSNVALTAFEARRNEERPEQLQAFARIENFGPEEVEVTAELYLDDFEGRPIDVARARIPAPKEGSRSGAGGVEFRLSTISDGKLLVKINHDDPLSIDNRAYAVVNPPQPANVVFVSPGNPPFEKALTTSHVKTIANVKIAGPQILEQEAFQREAAEGKYQLIIYDRCQPVVNDDPAQTFAKMPQANTLFLGALPPTGTWTAKAKVDVPQVIDTERVHPLMQLIEFGDVVFLEGTPLEPPPGSTVLIDTHVGPLFAIGPRGGLQDAVLGTAFVGEIDGVETWLSNWPKRQSFPLFVFNVLQFLGGGQRTLESSSVLPGQPISFAGPADVTELSIHSPSGNRFQIRRNPHNRFDFSDTDEQGVYEVYAGDKVTQRFCVNLFDSAESDIRPRPELAIGNVTVQGESLVRPARQEVWKILLLVALAVLMFEWYIYNRRVYL